MNQIGNIYYYVNYYFILLPRDVYAAEEETTESGSTGGTGSGGTRGGSGSRYRQETVNTLKNEGSEQVLAFTYHVFYNATKESREGHDDEEEFGQYLPEPTDWEDVRIMYLAYIQSFFEQRLPITFKDVLEDINYYTPKDTVTEEESKKVTEKASVILTTITNIGTVTSIIMLAVLGVKYMLGSVEEKADYKQGLVPYLIGAILLFSINVIVKALMQIGQSFNT